MQKERTEMARIIVTPIVGAAVTGLTSPGYPLSNDTSAPGSPSIQYFVASLTGTQTGVRTHSISSPFTLAAYRPVSPKTLGTPNPTTGRYSSIPSNSSGVTLIKGVAVAADQPYQKMYARLQFQVPAGSETYDAANVAAAVSCIGGIAYANGVELLALIQTGAMVQT
jgi:hypothetical protein